MRWLAFGAVVASLLAITVRRPLRRLIEAGLPNLGGGLDTLTKEELYERARKADIPGRSDMTKDELIRALGGS